VELLSKVAGYSVNFTHFVRLEVDMTELHCQQAVGRYLAYYVRAGATGVDLVIIFFKIDATGYIRVIPFRVQVKNWATNISAGEGDILLNKMAPTKCQPHMTSTRLELGALVTSGLGGCCEDMKFTNVSRLETRQRDKITQYYAFGLDMNNVQHFPILRNYKVPLYNKLDTTKVRPAISNTLSRNRDDVDIVNELRSIASGPEDRDSTLNGSKLGFTKHVEKVR
jgi:hypothetical protein